MRSTAFVLIVSLIMATSAFAQEPQTWRKVADTIPLGSKVKIQLIDGKRINGTLLRVDDTGVLVKKSTRIPEPALTVTYDQIGNIERNHGGGMTWGKAVGLGLGVGAGAILTILVIALQLD